MKKLNALILVSALAASTGVFADAAGPSPACAAGAANIEIYNKNLASDDCSSATGAGKYCMFDIEITSNDHTIDGCGDSSEVLYKNTNESYSLKHAASRLKVTHYLYTKGGPRMQDLNFVYENGVFSNNCAEVFGADVKCVVTKSGTSAHPLYKVVISKND